MCVSISLNETWEDESVSHDSYPPPSISWSQFSSSAPLINMAAIIAQISLQAANRRKDQTKRIPIDKSNVKLPSFDTHFDPTKHNAYTMRYLKIFLIFCIFTTNSGEILICVVWWLYKSGMKEFLVTSLLKEEDTLLKMKYLPNTPNFVKFF